MSRWQKQYNGSVTSRRRQALQFSPYLHEQIEAAIIDLYPEYAHLYPILRHDLIKNSIRIHTTRDSQSKKLSLHVTAINRGIRHIPINFFDLYPDN